jgi:ribosome-associated protein
MPLIFNPGPSLGASPKAFDPKRRPNMIRITSSIAVDEREINETFVRASGPGGQNVNKVSTAIQLRFDVERSPSLSEEVKTRLKKRAGSRMTDDGVLVIQAERFRSQARNRRDAMERLVALIREASEAPKKRRKTRPSAASKERRLESKRYRGRIKQMRRTPADCQELE